MLHVLLESGAHRAPRHAGPTLTSVFTHAMLIGAAVFLTTRDLPLERVKYVPPKPPIFVHPHVTDPVPSRSPALGETMSRVTREMRPIDVPSVPPVALTPSVGTSLPTPTLGHETPRVASPALPANRIYEESFVDRTVSARSDNPRPEYPAQLQSAMVEGEVLVRFVVDSTGGVERSSIVVVHATHALFGDAVRRWLARTRYAPAEVGGQPVRQLVQQTIGFTLKR